MERMDDKLDKLIAMSNHPKQSRHPLVLHNLMMKIEELLNSHVDDKKGEVREEKPAIDQAGRQEKLSFDKGMEEVK